MKPLKRMIGLWHTRDGVRVVGPSATMRGDCSGLSGNCTGLSGDCSWLSWDLDNIPMSERKAKPDIADWTEDAGS